MDLERLLRAQDGVVTVAQVVACGISARTARRWVTSGRWSSPFPGVLVHGGHPYGAAARCRAAWFWSEPRATLHGPSAAWWHGMLRTAPKLPTVTVPRAVTRRARGVRLRRRDLDDADRCELRGLVLTAEPLTALETAVAIDDGSAFLDRALQKRVTFAQLHDAWCRMAGATGATEARRLLVAAGDGAASHAERRLVRLLREAGITGWVLGHPVGPYEIDLAFPEQRVAIEFDGWAWHSDVERFRADRRKGNALVNAGWTLLRVTWHDLDQHPRRVLGWVRAALRRAP